MATLKTSKHKIPVTADANLTSCRIGEQVRKNMHFYGKDVVEDRAIPDYRDGCKPSQRRILYSMKVLGLKDHGNPKKSARVIGDAIGKFHPHGDVSLYGALANMVHSRYPMVDGCEMNFGNLTDGPAAMRYTEARFTKIAMEHFKCLDVAEMVQNYAGDEVEPVVVNTRLPLLMMNGTEGVAYGMATLIPSHNLEELVGALTHTAKHMKTVTCEDLLQYIKGPDFPHGGVLLSKADELLELYTNGVGKLRFRCGYTFEKQNDVTEIVVTEFPDPFNINSFLEACDELQEAKIIKRTMARYESFDKSRSKGGKQLVIRVSVDNKTAMEKILGMLTCSETYRFNVTIRGAEEGQTEVTSMTFVEWCKNWIRWRKQEEEKLLNLQLSRIEADLRREQLRLKGVLNIDLVIAAIKQDRIEPAEHLAKSMQIQLEDAQFIGAIPVFQLKKADANAQREKIKRIKDSMIPVRDDLVHLTRVVVNKLAELKPYFDERRTSTNARGPQLSRFETTGDPVIVAASTDGKLFSHLDEKSTTSADLFATGTFSGAVLFARNGMVCYLEPTEMTGKAGPAYADTVGIAQQELQWILGVGANGMCVRIPMQQRRSEFPLIKDTELIYGCGLNADSKLLVWGEKNEFQVLRADQIKEVTRANVAGAKLVNFKPARALVVHAGQSLFDLEGSSVAITRAGDAEDVVAIDSRNVVFLKSGRRKILDANGTKKALSSHDVKSAYPVTVPAT